MTRIAVAALGLAAYVIAALYVPVLRVAFPGAVAVFFLYAGWVALIGRRVQPFRDHWTVRPEVPDGAICYVALGDSMAQSLGATRVDNGYVPLLAKRLARETGRHVVIINLSAAGARVGDVLRDQLPQLVALPRRPDLVTLTVGSSDLLTRCSDLNRFERDFAELVRGLPAGTVVSDIPWVALPILSRRSHDFSDAIRRFTAGPGLSRVASYDATRAGGYFRRGMRVAGDWFHPNDRGHREWADAFWDVLVVAGIPERLRLAGPGAVG